MPRPCFVPVLLTLLTAACAAHEWNSPQTAVPPAAGWSGRLWAGPVQGAPPVPQAENCHRPPQAFNLDGPVPAAQSQRSGGYGKAGREELLSRAERAPTARSGSAEATTDAAAARAAPAPAPATAADEPAWATSPSAQALRPPPNATPVTAGVVDDNADFAAYLAYRSRHPGLPARDRDVSERYRLAVHDRAGRPVPDADVRLFAAGREQPLWARTDAGGQVWLHPRAAGLAGSVLEVQVSKPGADGRGTLQGRALLQRGQRDQLQITLDGAHALAPTRLDLVFLVDATGSMADEIGKLRDSMRAMADEMARLPSRPSICYGLVAYRDRGDAFFVRGQDFTDDLRAFQRGLAAVQAGGGGDMPEALNEALHTAVHRLSWRGGDTTRLVLLVADAPPHLDYGAPWYDDDMQGALARGIKLLTIGASGLDEGGEYVFRQMAQYTGGRFVFLTYADARQPGSGPGRETVHDVDNYSVQTLDRLVVRLVREELARRPG
jgi:Mg-chelatase subunit ChlD